MTGVEGYVESASSGLVAGLNAARRALGEEPLIFPEETALGAMGAYVARSNRNFQPMNITFGLMPPIQARIRDKKKRYQMVSERALQALDQWISDSRG
jgi:methylenetetrahydrofolate--tRNA-(uracil-5-)-methyltransferase